MFLEHFGVDLRAARYCNKQQFHRLPSFTLNFMFVITQKKNREQSYWFFFFCINMNFLLEVYWNSKKWEANMPGAFCVYNRTRKLGVRNTFSISSITWLWIINRAFSELRTTFCRPILQNFWRAQFEFLIDFVINNY